jgi:hypothetical protein
MMTDEERKARNREYNKIWREKNRERKQEQHRRWAENNPGKVKESNAKYYDNNVSLFQRRYKEKLASMTPEELKIYREKMNHRSKAWYKNNPEKRKKINRKAKLKKHYGLTLEEFDDLLKKQGGTCKTCWSPPEKGKDLFVDHDHSTGFVRGLLCHACNASIGLLKENRDTMREIICYLDDADRRQGLIL